ncbi:Sulfide:quinone oxidoreductase [Thelonectria olida]|uniref:Sulfide:quinone oxidoreductase n=1 Tax=Thelonectria olida TaxID=1576542 RepID=A0A9P8VWQ2_9HYPO|nr:Sulfide:quinone oxidoreductase [Thelonectria olida]
MIRQRVSAVARSIGRRGFASAPPKAPVPKVPKAPAASKAPQPAAPTAEAPKETPAKAAKAAQAAASETPTPENPTPETPTPQAPEAPKKTAASKGTTAPKAAQAAASEAPTPENPTPETPAPQVAPAVPPVAPPSRIHKIIVIGGGSAGLNASHQLLRSGKFTQDDIAVVDPAEWHHYQPGWTLVGGGLKSKEELRRPMADLIDPQLKFYNTGVKAFDPENNQVTLENGNRIGYEHLVVAPGIKINYDSVKGLPEALVDDRSLVSSIYGYETVDKVFPTIQRLQKGNAIFTQPAGVIKCAGAPQKIMWLALDHWKQTGLYNPENVSSSPIKISFATGLPAMFGVPKYSAKLEELRKERGVEGLFQHDLISIDSGNKATFAVGQEKVTKEFDLLHVVPKMGPHAFVKNSALANEAGYVDVDDATTRHNKFPNVWSIGDASSLPTSKTAAAITAESPVMVSNILRALQGEAPEPLYDGYTSCPLLTEYGKVLLAEFKYGGVPKETFDDWFGMDQIEPRRIFYHLKKDFFPWVYYNSMVKGTWGGPKGWVN